MSGEAVNSTGVGNGALTSVRTRNEAIISPADISQPIASPITREGNASQASTGKEVSNETLTRVPISSEALAGQGNTNQALTNQALTNRALTNRAMISEAITSEAITSEAGLRGLLPAWQDLWRRTPATTPFQHPDWQLAWWRQFGTGRPVLATLRAGGRLLGLLPAYVLEEGGHAKLLPIGAGISDSLDALVAPDAPPDAAARLLACLLAAAAPIDGCDLIDLPPGSALRHAAPPPGWQASLHAGAPCPTLPLPDGDFAASLPPNARRKLRMNRNRAERAGGCSLQLAEPDTLPELLATLFALHEAGWAARGEPGGVLADRRVKACLTDAAPALQRAGTLRVAALRIGPDIAAACMALLCGTDRLLLYLGGFSAASGACSPGSLLVAALAEHAIGQGVREIDFLRGNEAYKYAWGAADRHLATRILRPG